MNAGSDLQPVHRMKKWLKFVLLATVIVSFDFAHSAFAGQAFPLALEWQPCPDSGVAGYALYYGPSGTPLTNRMDVTLQTNAVVKGLATSAQYSFYVVAYDADLVEGAPSSTLVYTPQAISLLKLGQVSGGSMKISFNVAPNTACQVEYTDTLMPPDWKLLTTATGDAEGVVDISDPILAPGGSRFYRGVVADQ